MESIREEGEMSTRIVVGAPVATLINVFVVAPERQRELVELLTRVTEETMRAVPGFVSANLHVSTDGTRVVNYAQWESQEAFQAMLTDPVAREHMRRALEICESSDPHVYTVDSVHHA
jgi:quinol monooxygenase YgiN